MKPRFALLSGLSLLANGLFGRTSWIRSVPPTLPPELAERERGFHYAPEPGHSGSGGGNGKCCPARRRRTRVSSPSSHHYARYRKRERNRRAKARTTRQNRQLHQLSAEYDRRWQAVTL